MIKVIFFDGDGTLWYPKATMRTKKPHWVYSDKTIKDPIRQFVVTPGTIETLKELGCRKIKRVLLSTSPLPEDEAILHRIEVLQHIGIRHLLDSIEVAPNDVEAKGRRMLELLNQYGLDKGTALQVGDTYLWDYMAATKVGVRAVLVKSEYQIEQIQSLAPDEVIDDLRGLLKILDTL